MQTTLMKRALVTSAFLVIASISIAAAQSFTFSNDLKVGNSGPDVVQLQTKLIASGYHIPSIESGAVAKGVFGSQTKAAVMQYQAAKGLPKTGFFGPLTRASINSSMAAMVVPPPSMTVTPIATTTASSTPVAVAPIQTTISTPGVAGTLAASLWATPANGTTAGKGQSVDVVGYKLETGSSDMALNSISIDFDSRFWLYASGITLKDDLGRVIATKTNLSASDFSELTVGSDYRLTVPVNYVIAHGTTRYITMNVQMLSVSDRTAGTLGILQSQFRSQDGTGVTDTETVNASVGTADRTFNYTGSNTGLLVITGSMNDPLDHRVVISRSVETDNVMLAIANFQLQNNDGLLRKVTFFESTSKDSSGFSSNNIFRDIKFKAGNQIYSATSIQYTPGGSIVTIDNMSIPLPKDQVVEVMILGKIAPDTNGVFDGVTASTTLIAAGTAGGTSNNPLVEDSSFNSIDVNDAPLVSSQVTLTESDALLMTKNPVTVAMVNAGSTAIYNVAFNFSLTAGDNTLYVSKDLTGSNFISTTTTGAIKAKLTSELATPDTLAGDSNTEYIIPAGSSRTFALSGSISGASGSSGIFKISGVKFGTASGVYDKNVVGYFLGLLQTNSVAIP